MDTTVPLANESLYMDRLLTPASHLPPHPTPPIQFILGTQCMVENINQIISITWYITFWAFPFFYDKTQIPLAYKVLQEGASSHFSDPPVIYRTPALHPPPCAQSPCPVSPPPFSVLASWHLLIVLPGKWFPKMIFLTFYFEIISNLHKSC